MIGMSQETRARADASLGTGRPPSGTVFERAHARVATGVHSVDQWNQRWRNYVFEGDIDWKRIPEEFLTGLYREADGGKVERELRRYRNSKMRFDVIIECATKEYRVEEGGTRVAKRLAVPELEEFLRGARVFLSLRRLHETREGEPCDLHFIKKISEAAIKEYLNRKADERQGLFAQLMPALIEQPGYEAHPENVKLAGEVARILFLTLYNSMFEKQKWVCPCGAEHDDFGLKIPEVIEKDALSQLPGIIMRLKSDRLIKNHETGIPLQQDEKIAVCLLCGDNTREYAGWKVMRVLEEAGYVDSAFVIKEHGKSVAELIAERGFVKSADEKGYVYHSTGDLPEHDQAIYAAERIKRIGAHVVIGVGGGTPTDVAKLAAHLAGVPFVSVPTALSTDGIASRTSSLKKGGVEKHSISATAPAAVIIDLDVVSKATGKMTAAGFGDVLKTTEVAEAQLAWERNAFGPRDGRMFTGSEHCPFIGGLLAELARHMIETAGDLRDGKDAAFQRLARYAIISGTTTGAVGDSCLISRGSHLASHKLDLMLGEVAMDRRSHGGQVAVFSLLSARIYRELFGKHPHGVSCEQLKKAYETVGTPTAAGHMRVNDDKLIDAYVNAQKVRMERYTLLCELYRIFNVELRESGNVNKIGERLRELHREKYGAEITPAEASLLAEYGEGERGLRTFVWKMALEAGVVSTIPEEYVKRESA